MRVRAWTVTFRWYLIHSYLRECAGVPLGLSGLRGASSAAMLGKPLLEYFSSSIAVLAKASSGEGPVAPPRSLGGVGSFGGVPAEPRTKLSARCSVRPG